MNRYDRVDTVTTNEVDAGLRSYMLRVYNYMGVGLIITGLIAFFTANSPAMLNIVFTPPMSWVVMFAPLVFILVLSFGVNKLSAGTAQLLFWIFSAVMGLSLSSILLVYTGASVARVFFITAATFLTMSIYGYTTKADLSKFGAILFMGLIGIVIASIVNIFLKSTGLELAISIFGVIIFTGLTAWDTQKIKNSYDDRLDAELLKKTAVMGALSLYLDFINLFIMLLRLIGDRR